MSTKQPALEGRRWLTLAVLALTAGVLIPAALALACNPQAYLTLDKAQYAPGDTVRVSGSFFRGDANVTVSIDRTGQSAVVHTSGNGAFQTSFALPAGAPTGGYSVSAIGYETNGDVVAGLPARASFTVAAAGEPASTASGGGSGASTAAATSDSAPAASTPATSSATTRPTARPSAATSSSAFREPAVISEPSVQASARRSTSSARRAATSNDRATAGGRAVFGGSVAPAVSATPVVAAAAPAAATASRSAGASNAQRSTSQSARVTRQAAEQTAADDVWGALGSGDSPSVLPVAGDGVSVSSPQSGSQLALGLLLLGGGALALVGGLVAGEARKRRVRVR